MTTKPQLAPEDVHEFFDFDPSTGNLYWRDHPWQTRQARAARKPGARAGKPNKLGYIRISLCPFGTFYAHRLAYAHETDR